MNHRVIEVDADSQPRKWRDGRDPRGAGGLPTRSKRRFSERDAPAQRNAASRDDTHQAGCAPRSALDLRYAVALPLSAEISSAQGEAPVWSDPRGKARGEGLSPLHR